MNEMAFQITGVSIVCLTACWAQIKENIEAAITALCEGNAPVDSGFPSRRASNAENVSIWWRHHVYTMHPVFHAHGSHFCCVLVWNGVIH